LPLPVRPLPLSVMQRVNPHNSTVVKEIFESASQLQNVYQDFATLCQSVHR
jgi:hypothetical protein